jgi:peptide/nickel transport system substrate-binding protein
MKNINSSIKAGRRARCAAALLCAALLAGCGGSPSPLDSTAPTYTDPYTVSTPRPGGSLMLPMPASAELGNPLKAATREIASIYGMIFESLLTAGENGEPAACLAENWEKSEDGTFFTLKLRDGVKWQKTGRALNADDVVYTWGEIKTFSADTSADYPYDYTTKYISSCSKVDDRTVKFTLKTPFYGALQAFCFPILPSDGGYDDGGAPDLPVGTGPYEVTGYEKGKSIAMKANPDWWRSAPLIAEVNVMAFPDNSSEISSLTLRQLDALQTEDLTVAQYRDSGDAGIYEYQTRYFEYMALNFTSSDIQNKRIRQAIAYALNRQEIVSYTYVNHASITDTPVSYDNAWLYGSKLIQYGHNVEEARRLIMLAGWQDNYDGDGNAVLDKDGNPAKGTDGNPIVADGFWDTSPDGIKRPLTFKLITNMDEGNTLRNDAAALIRDQLAKAGIKVVLESETWDNYTTALRQKDFDLALCGCYLSPVPDYSLLFSSGSGGKLNVGGYKDDTTDAMLDDILHCYDLSTLKVKTADLQARIIDELPIISLYFRTHSLLYSPGIQGVAGAREDSAFANINQWHFGS